MTTRTAIIQLLRDFQESVKGGAYGPYFKLLDGLYGVDPSRGRALEAGYILSDLENDPEERPYLVPYYERLNEVYGQPLEPDRASAHFLVDSLQEDLRCAMADRDAAEEKLSAAEGEIEMLVDLLSENDADREDLMDQVERLQEALDSLTPIRH